MDFKTTIKIKFLRKNLNKTRNIDYNIKGFTLLLIVFITFV